MTSCQRLHESTSILPVDGQAIPRRNFSRWSLWFSLVHLDLVGKPLGLCVFPSDEVWQKLPGTYPSAPNSWYDGLTILCCQMNMNRPFCVETTVIAYLFGEINPQLQSCWVFESRSVNGHFSVDDSSALITRVRYFDELHKATSLRQSSIGHLQVR